jgi:UTP--glucose-1-phosphate uridylyltransferase
MPVGRKPILEHIIDEAAQAGITEVLFVISRDKTAISTHFGESLNGVRFEYVFQPEQKGLADAIYCGRAYARGEPFAVLLGDSIIETDHAVHPFRRLLDTYESNEASAAIVVQEAPLEHVSRYGIVRPRVAAGPAFEIDLLVEKPRPQDAPSRYAIAGRYVFDPLIFNYIERTPRGAGGEYQITDSIGLMLSGGARVWCVALGANEVRRDIGTFETYFEAFEVEIGKERAQSD